MSHPLLTDEQQQVAELRRRVSLAMVHIDQDDRSGLEPSVYLWTRIALEAQEIVRVVDPDFHTLVWPVRP